MKVQSAALFGFLGMLQLANALPSCCPNVATKDFHKQVLDNYIGLWGGDYSVASKLLDPAVVVYSDRLPSSTGVGSTQGNITSRDQYVAFVERSRNGWQEYNFEVLRWTSSDDNLALRWRMHGIIGDNFTTFPT